MLIDIDTMEGNAIYWGGEIGVKIYFRFLSDISDLTNQWSAVLKVNTDVTTQIFWPIDDGITFLGAWVGTYETTISLSHNIFKDS